MPDQDERVLSLVAYLLTWLTGLIVFLVAKPHQTHARWNGMQALMYGAFIFVVMMVVNLVSVILLFAGIELPAVHASPWISLGGVVAFPLWLIGLYAGVRGYQGRNLRLPVVAGLADRWAATSTA